VSNLPWARARSFAIQAHGDQKRKYTGEPYYTHLDEVAMLLHTEPVETIIAAYLHDVVEDTYVTLSDVYYAFGGDVAILVHYVTDISRPSDGNRAKQKEIDRNHIAQAPEASKIIKLADLISNTKSIVEHDPEFAKVYLQEKRMLLSEALCDVRDHRLYSVAHKLAFGLCGD